MKLIFVDFFSFSKRWPLLKQKCSNVKILHYKYRNITITCTLSIIHYAGWLLQSYCILLTHTIADVQVAHLNVLNLQQRSILQDDQIFCV